MAPSETSQRRKAGMLADEEVADFLLKNPDFLERHPELMGSLTPPSRREADGASVVDFQSFMVQRLQAEQTRMRGQLDDILGVARTNLSHQSRVHAAVFALLDARDFETLIEVVVHDLAALLDVDVVALVMEAEVDAGGLPEHAGVHRSGVRLVEPGSVGALMGDEEIGLDDDISGDPAIYGAGAGLVRSQALVRLSISPVSPPGLLALGARDPGAFHPGLGTELLSFLAGVVERLIATDLYLPR